MAEGSPLWDSGHLHHAKRNTDRRADAQCDKNPGVADGDVLKFAFNAELKDGPANSENHANFAGQNAAPRRWGRVHPLKSKNEQRAGYEINESDKCLTAKDRCHDFVGRVDFQHAVGDQESTNDIAGCRDHRQNSEDECKVALVPADQYDCADHSNGVESIGDRHQRGVQERRNALDHFKPNEPRQHEYEQTIDQNCAHVLAAPGTRGLQVASC